MIIAPSENETDKDDSAQKFDDDGQCRIEGEDPLRTTLTADEADDGDEDRRRQHIGMFSVAGEIMGKGCNQQPEEHNGADECGGDGDEHGDQHEDDGDRAFIVDAEADGRCPAE